jgi:hypothetical protein
MMHRRWLVFSGFVLLLIGFSMPWLYRTPSRPRAWNMKGQVMGSKDDFLSTEAGMRWQSGQPSHWRSYLLQH